MKKVIFMITALALMAITLPACAAEGVSQEEYEELKQQLDAIEAKFDPLEAGLSEQLRQQIDVVVAEFGPLVAKLSEIQEELEDVHTQVAEEPMTGQKLIGFGQAMPLGDIFFGTVFMFTNPDCVSEITIEQVSIIALDGTVIHEGELLDNEGIPLPQQTLGPHEGGTIPLQLYVARYYGIGPQDFRDYPPGTGGGTVEIFWTWTDKEGLPLTGLSVTVISELDEEGSIIGTAAGWSIEMVNMEQVLEPEG